MRSVAAAAIYARISADIAGEALGVQRQEESCRRLAEQQGWVVAEVYIDNDISAYSGKRRPAYERMLADIEAGTRDAVICVDLDRLTRQPSELERFIELADHRGVALANVSGDTDLSTSDGRFKARILGAVARQESEKKSERLKRQKAQEARRGLPHKNARRAFGYEADGITVRPAEAELVLEAAQRIAAGERLKDIALDWKARGIRTSLDGAWTEANLRNSLNNPRIIGMRRHRPTDRRGRIEYEAVYEAVWPAIVDRETWDLVQARLHTQGKNKITLPVPDGYLDDLGGPRARRRLLSGLLRCGYCGERLYGDIRRNRSNPVARYRCIKRPGLGGCGRLSTSAEPLEAHVRELCIAAGVGPEIVHMHEEIARRNEDTTRRQTELGEAEARLMQVNLDYGDGAISRSEWITMRDRLLPRIEAMRPETPVLPSSRDEFVKMLPVDEAAMRRAWRANGVDWRRRVVIALVDRIIVHPAPCNGGGGSLAVERIEPVWRI